MTDIYPYIASNIISSMANSINLSRKVQENRVRRAAERQNLRLHKIRRRDPRATDYGMYHFVHPTREKPVSPLMSLDEAEDWLRWDLERR